MNGNIYTSQRCHLCGGLLKNDENRNGCFCLNHPEVQATKNFRVILKHDGKTSKKRFQNYTLAQQCLAGWRYKIIEGTFDHRDYKSDNPLAFSNQSYKWLQVKKQDVSPSHHKNLTRYIGYALASWVNRNVKTIGYGDIEDLLLTLKVSDKTKHDALSCWSQFFKWLEVRENIPRPNFPKVDFSLGWREIIDLETQQEIIDKIEEIAPFKVWLGVKWMATYVAARPGEFWHLRERDININGYLVFPPEVVKTREPVLIPMLDEDIEIYKSLPAGMPDLPFFRWDATHPRTPGKRFGKNLFYQWWKRACSEDHLNITGVDLYGGTRHSTVTAMGEHFTEEEVKNNATMHRTTKAFDRYFQKKTKPTRDIYATMQKNRKKTAEITPLKFP